MITLSQTQREKLTKLIDVLPVDDNIKHYWLQAVKDEHIPKSILFDIGMTIEATEESRTKIAKNDKEVKEFFDQAISELKKNDMDINSRLTSIEQDLKKFGQEDSQHNAASNTSSAIDSSRTNPHQSDSPPPTLDAII